jgi:hypothetical protein
MAALATAAAAAFAGVRSSGDSTPRHLRPGGGGGYAPKTWGVPPTPIGGPTLDDEGEDEDEDEEPVEDEDEVSEGSNSGDDEPDSDDEDGGPEQRGGGKAWTKAQFPERQNWDMKNLQAAQVPRPHERSV